MAHSFHGPSSPQRNAIQTALLICISAVGLCAGQFLPQTSDGVIYFPGRTSTNANSIHNVAAELNRNSVLAFIGQPSRTDLPVTANPFQIPQPIAPSGPAFTSPSGSGGGAGSFQQQDNTRPSLSAFSPQSAPSLSGSGGAFQQQANTPNIGLLPPNRPPIQQNVDPSSFQPTGPQSSTFHSQVVARPTGQVERPVTTNSGQNGFLLNQFNGGRAPEAPIQGGPTGQGLQNANGNIGQGNVLVQPSQNSFSSPQRPPANDYYNTNANPPNAHVDFAWRLFSATRSGTANLVVSPILTQVGLAVLQYGAEGLTRRDLSDVVQSSIASVVELIKSLKSFKSQQTVIEYASTVFVNNNFKLNRTFAAIADEAKFNIHPVNFRQSAQTVQTINAWVSQATRRAIPAILDQNADTRHVEMLLANAIYFKSAWKYKFNTTETNYFYKAKANRKAVTFLKTKQYLRTGFQKAGNSGAYWVEVPYDGEEFSMVFLVPEFRDTLLTLISELTSSHVQTIINQLGSYNRPLVELKVPKFDIETRTSLLGPLRDIGLERLFADPSELVYINERQRTPVGDCIHNARLTVDETGTIAAAANTFSIIPLSISQPDPEMPFIVDQPFIAMIVDTRHNYPLFLAKIFDP